MCDSCTSDLNQSQLFSSDVCTHFDFYTYKLKSVLCSKIVTAIVLECCSPYSDTENSVRDLINSRLERNLTYRF